MEKKFSHSGNVGDIIYSLPFCLNCSPDGKFSMHLRTNVPAEYKSPHPFGKIRMSVKAAEMLYPLLSSQKYVSEASISNDIPAGYYDLDAFRSPMLLNTSAGSISQWYNILSVRCVYPADISKQWLFVEEKKDNEKIVIFRSSRYRRKNLNYMVLKDFAQKMIFIGLPEEHQDFCKSFFTVEFLQVKDFLEAANVINNARFIVGNQTGLFSLAEGIKVPRLLETAFECPNVVMIGGAFQYVVHTTQLQEVFKTFYEHFFK